MRHRLPPLNTLRLFEAAARLGSFKAAARELSLTPSAVSHGIQTLEDWLGIQLFIRSRRGIELSDAGARYALTVRESLSLLHRGTEQLLGAPRDQRLAVSSAPMMAARWLLPRLADFRARHPDVTVLVDTLQEQVSLQHGAADVAIRMGHGPWPGLAADRLFTERLLPVCAPELVEQVRASPESATCIHVRTASEDWNRWCERTGRPVPDPGRGLGFDTLQLAYAAAVNGLGLAVGRRPLVDVELNDGTLVAPWPEEVETDSGYWLVTLEHRSREPLIAAFRRWALAMVQ